MRKWAWHHSQKYVLLALFHYCLSFLIRDKGRSGVSSDKARQFQELLWCQITVVHHAALSLLLPQLCFRLPILQHSLFGRICWSPCCLHCEAERLWGKDHSWKSRQQPHLEIKWQHCNVEWIVDNPWSTTAYPMQGRGGWHADTNNRSHPHLQDI